MVFMTGGRGVKTLLWGGMKGDDGLTFLKIYRDQQIHFNDMFKFTLTFKKPKKKRKKSKLCCDVAIVLSAADVITSGAETLQLMEFLCHFLIIEVQQREAELHLLHSSNSSSL